MAVMPHETPLPFRGLSKNPGKKSWQKILAKNPGKSLIQSMRVIINSDIQVLDFSYTLLEVFLF
ncbi:hypothetical protein [Bartonella jaculi]|uniref:hypothetical protein n=1 Tax=Bartonella jaculi TaxID=686226 RepID=UPI0031ECAE2B